MTYKNLFSTFAVCYFHSVCEWLMHQILTGSALQWTKATQFSYIMWNLFLKYNCTCWVISLYCLCTILFYYFGNVNVFLNGGQVGILQSERSYICHRIFSWAVKESAKIVYVFVILKIFLWNNGDMIKANTNALCQTWTLRASARKRNWRLSLRSINCRTILIIVEMWAMNEV